MTVIRLHTRIKADVSMVFYLARSIDLHKISTSHTNEEAIGEKISGLIEIGETVTWRAKHFGFYQKLTSKITAFDKPDYFVDEMVSGAFKSFRHEHVFKMQDAETDMFDIFTFETPGGIIGSFFGFVFLKPYLKNLLVVRNNTIKNFAESEKWKSILQ